MSHGRELFVAGSADDLAREAASRLVELAAQALRERARFTVALSGGSTPRRLYQLLTQPPYRQALDWSRVHLFLADERFVPPADAESTARLVRETLLAGLPIAAEQFHAMPTEGESPETCATAYAEELARFFRPDPIVLDLALLGMGPDGHTASLFPGRPEPAGAVSVVRDSPKPPPTRLTLTAATLNRSRAVWFLVTGTDKAATLRTVFETPPGAPAALPAARIRAAEGGSLWLTDREAAAQLPAGS